MSDMARSKDESAQRKDLVVSVGAFDGFRWKQGRFSIGWLSFASAPRDLQSRLERAVREIDSLEAELDRVSRDYERGLAAAHNANEALKAQVARASADAEQNQRVLQEIQDLKAQLNRTTLENARLQALMERVSGGVR